MKVTLQTFAPEKFSADPGARTPIGASGIYPILLIYSSFELRCRFGKIKI